MEAGNGTNGSLYYDLVRIKEKQGISNVSKGAVVTAYVIILIIAFVGNSLVLHLVRTRVNIQKNPFNWLLVNTAAADLLDVVTASAFSLPYFFCEDCWFPGLAGVILCKLIPYLLIVSVCVSVLTLTVIAVDRYLGIVRLQREPLSKKAAVRSIVGVWLFAGLLFSGELYKYRVIKTEDGEAECYPNWSPDSEDLSILLYRVDMIVRVVVTYAIPLLFMSVVYSIIVWFLWRHKPPGNFSHAVLVKQERKTRLVIKMLVTAIAVFALGWLPVHFNHIAVEYYPDLYLSIPILLRLLFYWLAHANTAIHPWLFIMFSGNFREEARRMLRHSWRHRNIRLSQARTTTSSLPSLLIRFQRTIPRSSVFVSKEASMEVTTLDTKL